MAKTVTYNFREFMNGDHKKENNVESSIGTFPLFAGATVTPTGFVGDYVGDKIIGAFDPIIQLMQGLAYPIGFLTLSGGFILIMLGQKHKGIHMIKWACIGYVGLQFAPAIMKILVEVGKAMIQ